MEIIISIHELSELQKQKMKLTDGINYILFHFKRELIKPV